MTEFYRRFDSFQFDEVDRPRGPTLRAAPEKDEADLWSQDAETGGSLLFKAAPEKEEKVLPEPSHKRAEASGEGGVMPLPFLPCSLGPFPCQDCSKVAGFCASKAAGKTALSLPQKRYEHVNDMVLRFNALLVRPLPLTE